VKNRRNLGGIGIFWSAENSRQRHAKEVIRLAAIEDLVFVFSVFIFSFVAVVVFALVVLFFLCLFLDSFLSPLPFFLRGGAWPEILIVIQRSTLSQHCVYTLNSQPDGQGERIKSYIIK